MNCGGIKHVLCNSAGRGTWKLSPGLISCDFSFAVFALYPLTIINLSYEYNYMLSPVSTSREPPNLEGGLQDPRCRKERELFKYWTKNSPKEIDPKRKRI